jgi:heme exporter protein CcmD
MAGNPYAIFILGAYGAAAAIVAGLVAWIALDRRHLLRLINELETKGITRGSSRGGTRPYSGEKNP